MFALKMPSARNKDDFAAHRRIKVHTENVIIFFIW